MYLITSKEIPPLCYFVLFSINLGTPFINKTESSKDLTICCPWCKILLWIYASAVDAAVVNLGIKTLLANGWGTFNINLKPVFSNSPRCLSRNPPTMVF